MKKLVFLAGLLFLSLSVAQVSAMVRGECVNCHTMHNSQDGSVVDIRPDSAFSPDDADNFTVVNLLNNTCIGCHSSASGDTIVELGQSRIPIVLNLSKPTKPLAGGNFFWVETSGDGYGHNVRVKDTVLLKAPGGETTFGVVPNNCGFEGCHISLASIRYAPGPTPRFNPVMGNGCVGCHDPAHHADDERTLLAGGAKYVDGSGGGYRFLNKAGKNFFDIPPHNTPPVVGIEDPDWEQNPSASTHNEYQDSDKAFAPLAYGAGPNPTSNSSAQGMSDFCGGCHNTYHSWPLGGSPNGGASNPWLRHPASTVIPDDGEYAEYRTYDPSVPVARADVATLQGLGGPSSSVTPGSDKVMCLSCHRAHASEFPDMLRWDYSGMLAGTPDGPAAGSGCFKCHSQKDD